MAQRWVGIGLLRLSEGRVATRDGRWRDATPHLEGGARGRSVTLSHPTSPCRSSNSNEPRSLDSESNMLTVIPQGQLTEVLPGHNISHWGAPSGALSHGGTPTGALLLGGLSRELSHWWAPTEALSLGGSFGSLPTTGFIRELSLGGLLRELPHSGIATGALLLGDSYGSSLWGTPTEATLLGDSYGGAPTG